MAQQTPDDNKEPDDGNALQPPPIVPPKRKSLKPKITLKMPPLSPQLTTTIYSPGIGLNVPLTPATGNFTVNVFEAYPNKTQEFIFKQFAGFKDFTMNTGKIGLSFGEKMVFWTYGKVRQLSKNNFTHIFLFFLVVAYCLLGGILFHLAERGTEDDNIKKAKREMDHFVNYTIGVVTAEHCQNSLTSVGRRNITSELINLIFDHGNNLKKLSVPTMVDYIYFSGTVFTTIELATSSKYLTSQIVNDTENTRNLTSSSKNRTSRSHRKHKRQLTPDLLRKNHKSDSEKEEDENKKKYVTKKTKKEKSDKSGYSSSEENTDTENESKFGNSEFISENHNIRKRNTLKITEENKETHKEIFLQEEGNKASDVTDAETSDDFWKSQEQKQESKLKKRKTLKIKKCYKWSKSIRELITEWNYFKEEEQEQVKKIKALKNQCMIELLIVFIYLGIGGMIFRITEGSFEMLYKCGVKRVKRDFLDNLWEKSRYLREDEWKSEARIKLMEFENQLYDAYEAGLSSYSGQKGWSFINSIVYCITVITTIGYGHMSPDTNPGKFITIIYSLFGIPMFLILLADYGKLFTRGIKFVWAFVRRLYYTGSCRKVRRTAPVQEMMKGMQMVYDMTKLRRPSAMVDENCTVELNKENETQASPTATPAMSAYTIDDEFNLPISVAFTILVVYMVGGALFFSHTEDWEFFKAFYFVYISISTIGFGDIVPRSQWFLMLVSLVYFVFGLALTSMCINVVQEKLSDSIRQASAKIGARIGFEETEEENNANKLQIPVAE